MFEVTNFAESFVSDLEIHIENQILTSNYLIISPSRSNIKTLPFQKN